MNALNINPLIVVSAVCVFDEAGRLLTVRKRGTDKFMHPGGKPETGETAAQAAARELAEEVGIVLAPEELVLAGHLARRRRQRGRDADPGHGLHRPGRLARPPFRGDRRDPLAGPGRESCPDDLAPLLTDHVLPALWGQPG